MPTAEYGTSPRELRNFSLIQLAITAAFLGALFWAFGGADTDRLPPWWLVLILLALVGLGAWLAERVWLTARPLDPAADPDDLADHAIAVFAGQTVRKLVICEIPLIIAVVVGFLSDYAGWPIAIAGLPGLVVLGFETLPTLRNTSVSEVMLDSAGAESRLVESFRSW